MKTIATLLISFALTLGAFAQPPVPPDLSKVTEGDIIKTVEHMQRLVKDAQAENATVKAENVKLSAKVDDALKELATERAAHAAAQQEAVKIQGEIDALNAKVVALTKERDAWKKRAVWLMGAVSVLAAFAALRFTKLLPFPWSYAAAAAIGGAIYLALYKIL